VELAWLAPTSGKSAARESLGGFLTRSFGGRALIANAGPPKSKNAGPGNPDLREKENGEEKP